jgi:hypothetical protein
MLVVEGECPDVKKLADQFGTIHPLKDVFMKRHWHETPIYNLTCRLPHLQCPVIVGMVKAIEIAMELALPKDVHIALGRE